MKFKSYFTLGISLTILGISAFCLENGFHNAPPLSLHLKNPYKNDDTKAIHAGAVLFAKNCASCHGKEAMGSGNIPALTSDAVQRASDGEVFWVFGEGPKKDGMPPSKLPKNQRWQVITFVKSLGSGQGSAKS